MIRSLTHAQLSDFRKLLGNSVTTIEHGDSGSGQLRVVAGRDVDENHSLPES